MQSVLTTIKTLSNPANIKALLMPFRSSLAKVGYLMLGFILGVVAVWISFPTLGIQWGNAEPVHLADGYKDTWVKNTAILSGVYDPEKTKSDLEAAGYGPEELQVLADANAGNDVSNALRSVAALPNQEAANDQQAKINSGGVFGIVQSVLCFVALTLLFGIVGIVLSFRRGSGSFVASESTAGLSEKEQKRRDSLAAAREHAGTFEQDLGEPVGSFMSAYVLGDDLYDDSFPIEPDGRFAGEFGIEISETIGVGDPKKVTAFEIWIFDQQEIQTVTYVVMSEHAYNDPSLRAKLNPRGEAVLAMQGQEISIRTKTLLMKARIVDLTYGEGSLPQNSFFENITFSLAVWEKEGAAESAGAGFPPMPQMPPPQPPMQQAPPPQQPTYQPPPPGGSQPLTSNQPTYQPPPPGGSRPLTQNAPPPPRPQQPPPQQQGYQPPPPGGSQPLTQNSPLPPQRPQQPGGQPLTNNPPPAGGMRPLTNNPPPPDFGRGQPLTNNAPPPRPPQGQSGQPLPPQQPPNFRRPQDDYDDEDDNFPPRRPPGNDPFGDTGQF